VNGALDLHLPNLVLHLGELAHPLVVQGINLGLHLLMQGLSTITRSLKHCIELLAEGLRLWRMSRGGAVGLMVAKVQPW
jgi:hypothetical protein